MRPVSFSLSFSRSPVRDLPVILSQSLSISLSSSHFTRLYALIVSPISSYFRLLHESTLWLCEKRVSAVFPSNHFHLLLPEDVLKTTPPPPPLLPTIFVAVLFSPAPNGTLTVSSNTDTTTAQNPQLFDFCFFPHSLFFLVYTWMIISVLQTDRQYPPSAQFVVFI